MSIPYENIEKEIEDFLERVEQGCFTAEEIAIMAVKAMSPEKFADVLDANEISNRFWIGSEEASDE